MNKPLTTTENEITYTSVTFYEGREPIGCADIEIFDDEIWLNHFAIREDFRNKGYGQRALQILIDKYGANTLSCDMENQIALHIYKKYDFEIVEESNSFDDGQVYIMKRTKNSVKSLD